MNYKNITPQYTLVQTTFWAGFASVSAFASVYLLGFNISNSAIGFIIAFGALVSALIQPVIGNLIDNNPKFTNRKVLSFAAFLAIIIAVLLYPVSHVSSALVAVFYGILVLLIQFGQPFTNALGMASSNAGFKLLFGPARAIGSLGYALIAYILGIVTVSVGPHIVPMFIAVIFVLHFLSLVTYPLKEKSAYDLSGSDSTSSSVEIIANSASDFAASCENNIEKTTLLGFLKKYHSFSIMLIGLVMIYFSHVVLNSFAIQIVTPRGGSSANMGTATAISAGIELVPMFLFPIIRKKVKINHLLRLSTVFFTIKVLVTYLAPNVTAYYAAQGCQMLGWGIMAVAIVYYVNDNIQLHDQAQGQAFAGMSLTVGNVLGGMFGGIIIDAFGIDTLLIIGLICAAIGTAIFWIGIGHSEKHRS